MTNCLTQIVFFFTYLEIIQGKVNQFIPKPAKNPYNDYIYSGQ